MRKIHKEINRADNSAKVCKICGKPETLTFMHDTWFTDFLKFNQVHMACADKDPIGVGSGKYM